MKKLLILAAAAVLSVANAGVPRLDIPFEPDEDVRALVQTAPGWAEVYRVEPAAEKDAIQALVENSVAPPAVAVEVAGRLHFSQEKAPGELGEASMTITRKGASIEYDDNCKVYPKAGDVIESVYRSSDGEVEIITKTTIREHFAFGMVGELAKEPIRLNLAKKEHCDAVLESRILSAGTLTFKLKGKVAFRESILLQTIASP